jgi:hypothetical protein
LGALESGYSIWVTLRIRESLLVALVVMVLVAFWAQLKVPGQASAHTAALGLQADFRPATHLLRMFSVLLGPVFGTGVLITGLCGAGAGVLYGLRQQEGRGIALTAVGLGALSAPFVRALALGTPEFLTAALIAPVLVLSEKKSWLAAIFIALCSATDARLGLAAGLCGALAGGGWISGFVGVALAGIGGVATLDQTVLDPGDVGRLLMESAGPGLALTVALLFLPMEARYRKIGLISLVFAFGPVLAFWGEPLKIAGLSIPLPGLLAWIPCPSAPSWAGFLVAAAVAAGLGIQRPAPWLWLLIGLDAWRIGGLSLPTSDLSTPLLVSDLKGQPGRVLGLPIELKGQSLVPAGTHARYSLWAAQTQRTFLPGPLPLGTQSPLFGEPAVVLALDAIYGLSTWLIPPSRPGSGLVALGITQLIIWRERVPESALELLDALYPRWFGAPQKDQEAGMDLYQVPLGPATPIDATMSLHRSGEAGLNGWKNANEYLKELQEQRKPPRSAEKD